MERIELLLVDDEKGFRAALSKRLSKREVSVAEAGSGEECLKYLEQNAVEVIVLDVNMPGLDGIETLRKIKKHHPNMEVILLTGKAAVADGVEGIKAGAFDYLCKPVEIDHLMLKIGQAHEKIMLEKEKEREKEKRAALERRMIDTERLVSLGRLSSGVAHEINNPLAVINEAAGVIRIFLSKKETADLPYKKEMEIALQKIESSVARAGKITHQLLGYAKDGLIEFAETDLLNLIYETLELLARETGDKQVKIDVKAEEKIGTIWSDPYQIRQVLINILSNAIDAVKREGSIRIRLSRETPFVRIEIEDNGEGIPGENIGKIFDPFFTTKPVEKGTGLGLYVTAGIVSNLKGEIDVKSRLGKGTAFIVKLPRHGKNPEDDKGAETILSKVFQKIQGEKKK